MRATNAPLAPTLALPGTPVTPPTQDEPPIRRAETPSQARTWDAVASTYRRAGYCDRCAAQAAWAHQVGWTRVRPPCATCNGRALPEQHDHLRARRWAGRDAVADDHLDGEGEDHHDDALTLWPELAP